MTWPDLLGATWIADKLSEPSVEGTMSGCQPGPGKVIVQADPCSGEGRASGELEGSSAFDLI